MFHLNNTHIFKLIVLVNSGSTKFKKLVIHILGHNRTDSIYDYTLILRSKIIIFDDKKLYIFHDMSHIS